MAEEKKHGLMEKALTHSTKEKSSGLFAKVKEMKTNVKPEEDIIVEKDGVFTIQDQIETSSVEQDPALKELIDSVLR